MWVNLETSPGETVAAVGGQIGLAFPGHSIRVPVACQLTGSFGVTTGVVHTRITPGRINALMIRLSNSVSRLGSTVS